jgi:hypothetical protein
VSHKAPVSGTPRSILGKTIFVNVQFASRRTFFAFFKRKTARNAAAPLFCGGAAKPERTDRFAARAEKADLFAQRNEKNDELVPRPQIRRTDLPRPTHNDCQGSRNLRNVGRRRSESSNTRSNFVESRSIVAIGSFGTVKKPHLDMGDVDRQSMQRTRILASVACLENQVARTSFWVVWLDE